MEEAASHDSPRDGMRGGFHDSPHDGMRGGFHNSPRDGMRGGFHNSPRDGMRGGFHVPLWSNSKHCEAEAQTQTVLREDQPFLARIDGHRFSTFTKLFYKPYDDRIARAMCHTAADALHHFGAACAYTQSDEITLYFPAFEKTSPEQTRPYRGRVHKLLGLLASYVTVRFVRHLRAEAPLLLRTHVSALCASAHRATDKHVRAADVASATNMAGDAVVVKAPTAANAGACDETKEQYAASSTATADCDREPAASLPLYKRIAHGGAREPRLQRALADLHVHFDARVCNVPSTHKAVANMLWRASDNACNAVQNLARAVLPRSKVHGAKLAAVRAMLDAHGVRMADMPAHFRFGTVVKKVLVQTRGVNPQMNTIETTRRKRPCFFSLDLASMPRTEVKALIFQNNMKVSEIREVCTHAAAATLSFDEAGTTCSH